jgi:hypothetical protein
MRLSIVTLLVILSLSVTAQNPDSLKKERYLEIGAGLFTVGDIVWANDDFEKYKPSYTSFFQRNKEANSKALPLLITYKKQIKQGDWSWYTSLLLEFARKRNNNDFHYYSDYRGIYSNIWGLEYKYISRRNFSLSFKIGLGLAIVHEEERSNNPYLGTIYYPTSGNNTYILPIPSGEIQPLSFRFGNKNAAYLNLSLGTTGFFQFGYSRKW